MQLRNALACAAASLIASISADPCFGQVAPQSTAQTDQLQEVVVTGVRKSIGTALELKKVADQIQDSIVAEDIGKLSDNNVIEALQHVTGVQISRNAAEADQLLIRGLPDIETLLNWREIFTSTLKAKERWRGPGGCGVFQDGGRDYIVYHAYDAWHHGIPTLRIAPLAWTADGWPTVNTA